jgi:hypothetical protein
MYATTLPMVAPVSDLATLLRSLAPELHDGVYVYASVTAERDLGALAPIVVVREREGVTIVVPEHEAERAGLAVLFRADWITLTVSSDLQAVGLTAAFATALGAAGIPCNVVAGAYHDHVFVPAGRGGDALVALRRLQETAA